MKYWETAVQVHSIGQTTKFHPQTQKLIELKIRKNKQYHTV